MSEVEFLRRQKYKRNRKRWALVLLVATIVLAVAALVSFLVYHRIDKTQLIEYTESGNVDYRVQYKENEFFPDEWIGKDQTYIASLINGINADFVYNLDTSSEEMKYNYQYVINAVLSIESRDKGTPYYKFEEQLSPQKSGVIKNQASLEIKDSVSIDYLKYNLLAKSFINTYGLDASASCTLIVTLDVVTLCENNGFENSNQVNYSTSLNIPLAVDSVNLFRTSGSVEGQINNLEYAGATNRRVVLTFAIVFAILALLTLGLRTAFLILTRNEDVTYKARVNKIVRAYGSFIQKMFGEFDCNGYQMIKIKTFVEMLGIRDTIQSPVLMSENKDETMTRFYIPTDTKILYVFEIKVDNYDEIYGTDPDGNGPQGGGTDKEKEPEEKAEDVATVTVEEPKEQSTNAVTSEKLADAILDKIIRIIEKDVTNDNKAPVEDGTKPQEADTVTEKEPEQAPAPEEVAEEEATEEVTEEVTEEATEEIAEEATEEVTEEITEEEPTEEEVTEEVTEENGTPVDEEPEVSETTEIVTEEEPEVSEATEVVTEEEPEQAPSPVEVAVAIMTADVEEESSDEETTELADAVLEALIDEEASSEENNDVTEEDTVEEEFAEEVTEEKFAEEIVEEVVEEEIVEEELDEEDYDEDYDDDDFDDDFDDFYDDDFDDEDFDDDDYDDEEEIVEDKIAEDVAPVDDVTEIATEEEPEQAPANVEVAVAIVTEDVEEEESSEEETTELAEAVDEEVIEEEIAEEEATEENEAPVDKEPMITEAVTEELSDTMTTKEITAAIIEKLIEQDTSSGEEEGGDEVLAYLDEEGNVIKITCSRSFTANLIQAEPKVREYYNKIKNRILSYKGVKARMSWRNETFNKGRIQLFKMKIRGKTMYLYCALDPANYENSSYSFEVATAKNYAKVPMMVKIKSDRGLKRACKLVDDVMKRFEIVTNPKAVEQDFAGNQPYDTTKNLVIRGLIKILLPDAILSEPKPHPHHQKEEIREVKSEVVEEVVQAEDTPKEEPVTVEAQEHVVEEIVITNEDSTEEIVIFDAEAVEQADIESVVHEPTPELEEINYVDDVAEEEADFVETEEHPGVEVIGVVWPERPKRNKIYRYDPNGEKTAVGDVVIVPTRDVSSNREVIRKAAVAHANHKVSKEDLKHPLKKIVGVIRKKLYEDDDDTSK